MMPLGLTAAPVHYYDGRTWTIDPWPEQKARQLDRRAVRPSIKRRQLDLLIGAKRCRFGRPGLNS
jgi:hypothetical protein